MDFYHVLNRGVDKRDVFMDVRDYMRFLSGLNLFNDTQYAPSNVRRYAKAVKNPKSEKLVDIHCFVLMPNHYHMLISPVDDEHRNISLFMKKLNMGYAKYFNERHGRSGALWQGKYKKILVTDDAHLLYLPFYIHANPLDMILPEWRKGKVTSKKLALEYLQNYRWSSHNDYLTGEDVSSIANQTFFSDTSFLGTASHYKKKLSKIITGDKLSCLDETYE